MGNKPTLIRRKDSSSASRAKDAVSDFGSITAARLARDNRCFCEYAEPLAIYSPGKSESNSVSEEDVWQKLTIENCNNFNSDLVYMETVLEGTLTAETVEISKYFETKSACRAKNGESGYTLENGAFSLPTESLPYDSDNEEIDDTLIASPIPNQSNLQGKYNVNVISNSRLRRPPLPPPRLPFQKQSTLQVEYNINGISQFTENERIGDLPSPDNQQVPYDDHYEEIDDTLIASPIPNQSNLQGKCNVNMISNSRSRRPPLPFPRLSFQKPSTLQVEYNVNGISHCTENESIGDLLSSEYQQVNCFSSGCSCKPPIPTPRLSFQNQSTLQVEDNMDGISQFTEHERIGDLPSPDYQQVNCISSCLSCKPPIPTPRLSFQTQCTLQVENSVSRISHCTENDSIGNLPPPVYQNEICKQQLRSRKPKPTPRLSFQKQTTLVYYNVNRINHCTENDSIGNLPHPVYQNEIFKQQLRSRKPIPTPRLSFQKQPTLVYYNVNRINHCIENDSIGNLPPPVYQNEICKQQLRSRKPIPTPRLSFENQSTLQNENSANGINQTSNRKSTARDISKCVEYEEVIEILQPMIVQNLIVSEILTYLPFLDYDEIKAVSNTSPKEAVSCVLDELKKARDIEKWQTFMLALSDCGYEYIVKSIRGYTFINHLYQKRLFQDSSAGA